MSFGQILVTIFNQLHVPLKSVNFYSNEKNMTEVNLLFEQLFQIFEINHAHNDLVKQKTKTYFGR